MRLTIKKSLSIEPFSPNEGIRADRAVRHHEIWNPRPLRVRDHGPPPRRVRGTSNIEFSSDCTKKRNVSPPGYLASKVHFSLQNGVFSALSAALDLQKQLLILAPTKSGTLDRFEFETMVHHPDSLRGVPRKSTVEFSSDCTKKSHD